MNPIKSQYGFPLFVSGNSTDYLLKAEKIRVSDIWALWHYIIKSEKKRFPGRTNYSFLLSVLEQAQYFYEAASLAPIKSQPLLYYYSFLNIAKAAIVLKDSNLLLSGLEFNHGIDPCKINGNHQLHDCFVSIKNFINETGTAQKISVAYELARLFGDDIEFKHPNPAGHDNGPWKIDVISLLKSCIGIHRTVSETFKVQESFVRIEDPIIEKGGRLLSYKGIISATPNVRLLLSAAGYNLQEINQKWYFKEDFNMPSSNLSRSIFHSFSGDLLAKGLWTYTTGDEYRLYINSNHLIKNIDKYVFLPLNTTQPNIQKLTLSSATIIYYLMFFFGSITRYHPYLFEKVLSEKEIWLVSEFLKTQPLQFILLLTSKIIGKSLYTSRMPFISNI